LEIYVHSISYAAWYRVAAAYVQNCVGDLANPHTAMPKAWFKRGGGDRMKSMLFILVAQLHSGGVQTVGAYSSLEQCRDALKVATTNIAADYTCAATPAAGTWSKKDSRYLMARE
jgi:hypothetical protein